MSRNPPSSPLNYPANNLEVNRIFRFDRAPTTFDFRNFRVRDFWNDSEANTLYYLSDKSSSEGTWILLGAGATDTETLTGNTGGPVSPDGANNINTIGADPITVTGDPGTNTLTHSVADATTSQKGVVTFATNAETIAGTVTDKANTPDDLKAKLGVQTLNGLPIGASDSAAIAWTAAPTDGQVLIGSTGVTPVLSTLTEGAGVTIVNGAGSITISSAATGISWTDVTGTSQAMTADAGFVSDNAGLVTLTLPVTIAFGQIVRVTGKGAGGWLIAQNAGQSINFGSTVTTTGAGGSLASTNAFDGIELLCITANTQFVALSSIGNITVV